MRVRTIIRLYRTCKVIVGYLQVKGFPTILYAADKFYAYTGSRDINHLKNFARRDWEHVVDGAKSSIPPPTESLPAWRRYIADPAADFVSAVVDKYALIWVWPSSARPIAHPWKVLFRIRPGGRR